MSQLSISEKEREEIRKQHDEATKKIKQHVADQKAGVAFKKTEKPAEKKEDPKK